LRNRGPRVSRAIHVHLQTLTIAHAGREQQRSSLCCSLSTSEGVTCNWLVVHHHNFVDQGVFLNVTQSCPGDNAGHATAVDSENRLIYRFAGGICHSDVRFIQSCFLGGTYQNIGDSTSACVCLAFASRFLQGSFTNALLVYNMIPTNRAWLSGTNSVPIIPSVLGVRFCLYIGSSG